MGELPVNYSKVRKIIGATGVVFIIFIICMMYVSRALTSYLLPVVEFEKPKKGYVSDKISMEGVVKLLEDKNITAANGFRVLNINVSVGDVVKRGDVLLEYDKYETEMEIKRKELEIRRLSSEIKDLSANQGDMSVKILEAETERLLNILREEERAYQITEKLYNVQAESLNSLKSAESRMQQARDEYEIKKNELELKRDEMRKAEERNRETIALKESELDILKMELDRLKSMEKVDGKFTSDIDGIIKSISVEKGANVASGQVLFVISADKKAPVIECEVDYSKSQYIDVGNTVSLTCENPKIIEMTGKILNKTYFPEKGKFQITCSIDDANIELYDKQHISVEYTREGEFYDMILSKSCVKKEMENYYVYLLNYSGDKKVDITVKKVRVDILDENDREYAVRSSGAMLTSDTDVVTRSSKPLEDGMKVRIKRGGV